MALGAKPAQIAGMVLSETMLLVSLGLAIGIPEAMIASRLIASELYGLEPRDAITVLVATLVTGHYCSLGRLSPRPAAIARGPDDGPAL